MHAAAPRSTRVLPRPLLPGLLLTSLALAGSGRADAQPAGGPPLMPTRDVTVLYSVRPEGAPQEQQVRVYFHGDGLMRIDGPPGPDGNSQGNMILDRGAKIMTIVLNQQHVYMQIPERDEIRSPFVLDASMRFTRQGTGQVAGLPCVQWSIVSGKGSASACVTTDGVVLSESGVDGEGNKGQLVARTVQYARLDPSLFVPPAGYQRTAHPEGMGAGMGPGNSGGGPGLSGPQAGFQPGNGVQGGP